MKISALSNKSSNSVAFGKFYLANKSEDEKEAIKKEIKRRANIDENRIDVDKFIQEIDVKSTEHNYDLVISANINKGKNKTRVKTFDIQIRDMAPNGSGAKLRAISDVRPQNFIKRFVDFGASVGANYMNFLQSKKND